MRKAAISWVSLLLVLLLAGSTPADEVILKSGARFTGTIESESAGQIVIRTDLGRITFGRSLVKEIHRDKSTREGAVAARTTAHEIAKFDGVASEVRPAATNDSFVLALRSGEVLAARATDGRKLWATGSGGEKIVGLAADPGGVYVSTASGGVYRLMSRNGSPLWQADTKLALDGAPLLFRRNVFVFSSGHGLVGVECGTGRVRGLLNLSATLDTPLAAAGGCVIAGTKRGRLLVASADGEHLLGEVKTRTPWKGTPLAISLRNVVVGGGDSLRIIAPDRAATARRLPVPGLSQQPLAADPARAYATVSGVLSALDLVSGRIVWQSPDAGHVTGITVAPESLLAVTADGKLRSLSSSDGSVRWSTDLGAPAVGVPILVGSRILVVTQKDQAIYFEVTTHAAAPTPENPKEKGDREELDRTLHSADGYRVTVPPAWSLSEEVTRGPVSLGFRPDPGAPRFVTARAPDEELRRLGALGQITIEVLPRGKRDLAAEVAAYQLELKTTAADLGLALGQPVTGARAAGKREFTEIAVDLSPKKGALGRQVRVDTMIGPLDKDHFVRIELRVPEIFAKTGGEDLFRVAESLKSEKGYEPDPAVRAAEKVLAAISAGDAKALAPLLSDALRERVEGKKLVAPGKLSVPILRSRTSGSFEEVRARVDTKTETSYTTLLLSKENGSYVVIDAGTLL